MYVKGPTSSNLDSACAHYVVRIFLTIALYSVVAQIPQTLHLPLAWLTGNWHQRGTEYGLGLFEVSGVNLPEQNNVTQLAALRQQGRVYLRISSPHADLVATRLTFNSSCTKYVYNANRPANALMVCTNPLASFLINHLLMFSFGIQHKCTRLRVSHCSVCSVLCVCRNTITNCIVLYHNQSCI